MLCYHGYYHGDEVKQNKHKAFILGKKRQVNMSNHQQMRPGMYGMGLIF